MNDSGTTVFLVSFDKRHARGELNQKQRLEEGAALEASHTLSLHNQQRILFKHTATNGEKTQEKEEKTCMTMFARAEKRRLSLSAARRRLLWQRWSRDLQRCGGVLALRTHGGTHLEAWSP